MLALVCDDSFCQNSTASAIGLGGNFRISSTFYGVSGINNRRAPFSLIVSGSPYLEIYGQKIPVQFTISNFRSEFHQPFNQFGISPQYKWAKLHLGYRNLMYSQFTLGGARLFGVGGEFTPGKLYLSGVYGRFQAARYPGNPDQAIIPNLYSVGTVYERRGLAFKAGIGTNKTYAHLIFLKASDDGTSLEERPGLLLPNVQENSVFGINAGVSILKNLQWRLESALSAWTLNAESPRHENWPVSLSWIFVPRHSSQFLFAGETSLEYRDRGYAFGVKYRRVDPDYKSMGLYFVQADLSEISANFSIPIKLGRHMISGNFGKQSDNVYRLKEFTSSRLIYNGIVVTQITNWLQLSGTYTNFGITQSPVQASISDTLLLDQVVKNFSIGANVSFRSQYLNHGIRLQYMQQGFSDLRTSVFGGAVLSSSIIAADYNVNIIQRRINTGFGLQRNDSYLGDNRIQNYGINASFSKRLSLKNINLLAQSGVMINTLDGASNGMTIHVGSTADVPLMKTLRFALNLNYLTNQTKIEGPVRSFSEWTIRTSFQFSLTSVNRKS